MELQNIISENYQLVYGALTTLIAGMIIVIKSYLSEKGKLKALISENKKLVKQSEKIKAKYTAKLEDIRKEHQLEISRRKHQYESKQEIYLKFFKLVDEFSSNAVMESQNRFLPAYEEYTRNYLNAAMKNNNKGMSNAITVLQKKLQTLMFEANQNLIRIKQETNTIKMIASEAVLNKLDLLELSYESLNDDSNKMMKKFPKLLLDGNTEEMKKHQHELEISGRVVNRVKDDLIQVMREELFEI